MAMRIVFTGRLALIGLVMLLVVVGLGLAFVKLPRAVITVIPAVESKTVSQDIILSAAAEQPDFIKYILPARTLHREVVETVNVERQVGKVFEDFAKGQVIMRNDQDEEQRLLPQTHLKHEATGEFFLTDTGVAIPPKGEIIVSVTAKEKGARGNVEAGRLNVDKLSSGMQQVVYAVSQQAFSGGQAVESPVTSEELRNAKNEARNGAKERLRGELTAEAGGAYIRDDLITFIDEEITVSAEVGSQASQFSVRIKLAAQAFAVDENDVLSLTVIKLKAAAGADNEFVTYDPGSFVASILNSDFERGEAVIQGSLTGTFASKLAPTVFDAKNLAGLSADEVREAVEMLPGVGEAKVVLSPFWVTAVPSNVESVEITVEPASG